MGKLLLIVSLLVAALVFEVSANQGCPVEKGICMERKHCKTGRNSSRQQKCILPNEKHGVCCFECEATTGEPGICVADKYCGNYTRNFLTKPMKPSQECLEKNAERYCCPMRPGNDNAFPACQTSNSQPGHCVPSKLCDSLYGKPMSRSATKLNSKCQSNDVNSNSVCCQDSQNPDNLIQHRKARKFDLNQCGRISMEYNILGGEEADLHQFPWMANIMYHREHNNKIEKVTLCSGTLIHPKYVLTAAHCNKYDFQPISVRLGEHDLSTNPDCVNGVFAEQFIERLIEKWITHKNDNELTKEADIALVKLERKAKIIPGQISPICLPLTQKWLMTKPTQVTVSGWGLMGNQRLPDVLMKAQLQVLNQGANCSGDHVICARGADMEGHCQGDSGGPLQQIMPWGETFRMVLFGVNSAGAAECNKKDDMPGVSMLVGYYLHWILDNMEI